MSDNLMTFEDPRDGEKHRIVYLQYEEVKPGYFVPSNVLSIHEAVDYKGEPHFCYSNWDIEYCKRDACCYYHESGSGGGFDGGVYVGELVDKTAGYPLWYDREFVKLVCYRGEYFEGKEAEPITDSEAAELGWRVLNKPQPLFGAQGWNPFADYTPMREDSTVYCLVCEDNLPRENYCSHIVWNEERSWYGGCGAFHADNVHDESLYKTSFAPLLSALNRGHVERLAKSLRLHNYKVDCDPFDYGDLTLHLLDNDGRREKCSRDPDDYWAASLDEDNITDEMKSAIDWLVSLSAGKTDKFDDMTAGWIEEWLAATPHAEALA